MIGGDEPMAPPGSSEVHVWTASVGVLLRTRAQYILMLSPAERARATRFRREEDRDRYVTAHGWLRRLLGSYVSLPPSELEFVELPSGKPALVGLSPAVNVEFNLSHSGDLILVAVTKSGVVGVDVELIRSDFNVLELAGRYFSEQEYKALATCAPSDRTAAFFRCWTRKEAYVKAVGQGLGLPLDQFAVTFGLDELPQLVWSADARECPDNWSILNLEVGAGYAAAVVAQGRGRRAVLRKFGT